MLTLPRGSLLGAEQPRVELRPSAIAYSLGAEAVELAARAGLVCEPWQAEGLDLMLSVRPDGLWACFEYAELLARQNGKTTGLFAPRALAGMFLLGERLITWSAHEVKTAMRSFRYFERLLKTLGEPAGLNLYAIDGFLVKVNNQNGEEGFERLDTGQELKFIARSKGSGRGWDPDVQLHDEAFAYTEVQQSAQAPSVNARPNPQICYASSPPLDGGSGEVLYRLRERAESGDEGLGWRDWGLAGDLDDLAKLPKDERDEVLDDRARWAATNPAVGRGRMTEESIVRSRRSMSALDFAREVLGVWPRQLDALGAVIARPVWDAHADEDSTVEAPWAFAVDANPERSATSIGLAGRRADDKLHVEVIERRPGIHWVVDRVVELSLRYPLALWLIDPDGPAAALLPDLDDAGIEVITVSGRHLAQACGSFYDDVYAPDQDRIRHLGDPVLDAAVRAGRKRNVGDGAWRWRRSGSAADISPLWAVTLAAWGVTAHDQLEVPPEPMAVTSSSAARPETADLSRIGF